ncbi:MAG TPA: HD-GYP domain-containing protein [Candidatus Ozemobacteraceae bacterium]|nr:HD-GYP domain-containing protein [Candidatus Ozemobacteraceae bacterium]
MKSRWEKSSDTSVTGPESRTPDSEARLLADSLKRFSDEIVGIFARTQTQNAKLRDELEVARDIAFPAVLALSELMEGRDNVTYGHSRRVARICVQVVDHLRWPVERVKLMNMTCLLHDIGKVIIPDAILNKEGKFTPLEYETMKLHSSTGSRIVQRLGFLGEEAETWILHHHERWDGEGYPDGLTGDQIPLGARILCMADTYDALTTARRYRQKMEHWVALDEIVKCGGKQFDPDLAMSFLDALKEPPELEPTKNLIGS